MRLSVVVSRRQGVLCSAYYPDVNSVHVYRVLRCVFNGVPTYLFTVEFHVPGFGKLLFRPDVNVKVERTVYRSYAKISFSVSVIRTLNKSFSFKEFIGFFKRRRYRIIYVERHVVPQQHSVLHVIRTGYIGGVEIRRASDCERIAETFLIAEEREFRVANREKRRSEVSLHAVAAEHKVARGGIFVDVFTACFVFYRSNDLKVVPLCGEFSRSRRVDRGERCGIYFRGVIFAEFDLNRALHHSEVVIERRVFDIPFAVVAFLTIINGGIVCPLAFWATFANMPYN